MRPRRPFARVSVGDNAHVPGTARTPDCITLARHRDDRHLVKRSIRWVVVAILAAVALAGLANAFGQHPVVETAGGDEATLSVSAPAALRSGLLFQGKFEVRANTPLRKPTLVLDPGWSDAITVNSMQPEPISSRSDNGRVALEFDPLAAGHVLTVYLYLQANPTTVGRRDQGVALRDGSRTIATVDRTVIVFP